MKTLRLIAFGIMLIFAGSMQGQVSVRLNVGTPPQWGPAGYNGVRYYYLPDIESYYDVNNSTFIYFQGNRWIHSRNLPARYRNYDLYGGYKVVMNDYHGNYPYVHFRENRMQYARGYRGHEQRNIGERHDFRGRGHEMQGPNRRDVRGNDRGRQRDFNQNHGRENNQRQFRGNDRGHDQGNDRGHDQGNRGQSRGNDKNRNDGHDNGKR